VKRAPCRARKKHNFGLCVCCVYKRGGRVALPWARQSSQDGTRQFGAYLTPAAGYSFLWCLLLLRLTTITLISGACRKYSRQQERKHKQHKQHKRNPPPGELSVKKKVRGDQCVSEVGGRSRMPVQQVLMHVLGNRLEVGRLYVKPSKGITRCCWLARKHSDRTPSLAVVSCCGVSNPSTTVLPASEPDIYQASPDAIASASCHWRRNNLQSPSIRGALRVPNWVKYVYAWIG